MPYDLEQRCFDFALAVRDFCYTLQKDIINSVYIKQVVRSSSSIGANYIEANESLGKPDQKMRIRIRISRKEAKETQYWLKLIITENEDKRLSLYQEAEALRKILSAILNKLP